MRLFLIDSSIFIFRAWFGPNKDMCNLNQEPNQAFIGFCDFVYRLLTEQGPSKIVFAFDQSSKKDKRKEIYADYKANRAPAPIELKRQFEWCKAWIEALGISRVSSPYWEADDLIGSLAHYHRSDELAVVILTADKDLTQLITEGDLWWAYLDDKKLDYRGIIKKFKVRPEQIADQLALMGDKVDNIPGIPEVGLKTAANLLKKYGNIEQLRENLSEVGKMKFRYAARVQQSLIDNQHILDISLKLTRINCQIEEMLDVNIDRGAIDVNKLRDIMRRQDMDQLRQDRWLSFIDKDAKDG